jgi:selenocysteine-specific elongation factor
MDVLRDEVLRLRDRIVARRLTRPAGPLRLAIDRAFAVKGRGSVVTGTLRGGHVAAGAGLRLEPGGHEIRVREAQVHNAPSVSPMVVERHSTLPLPPSPRFAAGRC